MFSNIGEIASNVHQRINEKLEISGYMNFSRITDGKVSLHFSHYFKC